MNTVQDVLSYLYDHEDTYISGQLIASNLFVSRSAIWKAIETLRDEGYCIDAITNKGYRLVSTSELLDKTQLESLLSPHPLHFFGVIDSTNRYAKQLAGEGAVHGTTVISAFQSEGRGRLGRTFASPKGGMYISVILRPRCKMEDALLVTSAAAVAVSRAVKKVCNLELGIKWVNDLFYKNKKVCGILTEGVIDVESGTLSSLVVGMGVNFSTPFAAFDPQLQMIVTSLYDGFSQVPDGVDPNVLAAGIVQGVLDLSDILPDNSFLEEYRRRSIILEKKILVINQKQKRLAKGVEIDNQAHLTVEYPDGSRETLGTGEISIRLDV